MTRNLPRAWRPSSPAGRSGTASTPARGGPCRRPATRTAAGHLMSDRWHIFPAMTTTAIRDPLTRALDDPRSLVRLFLEDRFPHIRDIQRRYRESAPALVAHGN